MLQKWLVLRESELKRDGVLEAMRADRVTVKDVLEWYEHDFSGATKFGRTKLSAVKYLQSCPGFDDCDAVNLKPSDLIVHARRRAECQKLRQACQKENDTKFYRLLYRHAKIIANSVLI